jgi:hypothetical protein
MTNNARGTLNVAKNVKVMTQIDDYILSLETQNVTLGKFKQLTDWLYEISAAKVKEYKLL